MKKEKLYFGIDAGSSSIGFAVTDENYEIIRKNGKNLIGSRLYKEGETAKARRLFRSSRRRMKRRKNRIDILQDLFAKEIYKVDQSFFHRLEVSKLYQEDKGIEGKYSLFNDQNYTDKEFYKKYPTIYHLRKALVDGQKADVRELYLAIHHIIKYRGHFAFEGQDFNVNSSIKKAFEQLNFYLEEEDSVSSFHITKIEDINHLVSGTKGIRDLKSKLIDYFGVSSKLDKKMIDVMLGATFKLSDLFSKEIVENFDEKISFKNENFEEVEEYISAILGDDYQLIECLKQIYDSITLYRVTKGQNSISNAMITIYEKYRDDLRKLKNLIKDLFPDKYTEVFKSVHDNPKKQINNYVAYTGKNSTDGIVKKIKKCSREDFIKYLKSVLDFSNAQYMQSSDYAYIKNEIEQDNFLPEINSKNNAKIPYQLNKFELVSILDNASKQFDFLNHIEDGHSIKEKIVMLLEFKIPYYVGPLNDYHSGNGGFAWVIRKESGKVLPWNFNDKVDAEGSAQAFINLMKSKCTYLKEEYVLPKNSILYSKFVVLNELNTVKINGYKLNNTIKQAFFNDVFLRKKKVTSVDLVAYLRKEGFADSEELTIEGIVGEFNSSMNSYITLKHILDGIEVNLDIAEDVIFWHSIFTEKNMVEKLINDKYGKRINEEQIKKLKALNFKGWGRLSKKLLDEIKTIDKTTGEVLTIIDILWNDTYHFNEILFGENYDFQEQIRNINNSLSNTQSLRDKVQELYCSPSAKKTIWQAIRIVKELEKINKQAPDKIFVEFGRGSEEKKKGKKSNSRKENIQRIYNNIKEEKDDIKKILEELSKKTNLNLREERLFLYFMQLGRCAYSGDPIDLNNLSGQMYDVDHIYPKSKILDDSLTNKVLVKKELNQDKGDLYPVNSSIQNRCKTMWLSWLNAKLITKEKYHRLTRKEPLSVDEQYDFINRQLVFNNQSAKALAEILKEAYPNTEVIYSKAKNVSNFRNMFDFPKSREINNYHHAQDAYLNIVVGNVFNTKFQKTRFYEQNYKYDLTKLYDYNIKNAWVKDDNETLKIIIKNMAKNHILITHESKNETGSLYKQTIHPKSDNLMSINEKELSDTSKYGGYSDISGAYFVLVEHVANGKKINSIEQIPIYVDKKIQVGDTTVLDYLFTTYRYEQLRVICKIPYGQLLLINKCPIRVNGKSDIRLTVAHSIEWNATKKQIKYARALQKFWTYKKENWLTLSDDIDSYVISESSRSDKKVIISKKANIEFYNQIKSQIERPIYQEISVLKSAAETIKNGTSAFCSLNLEDQVFTLLEMMKILQTNSSTSDLTKIGGSKNSAKLLISKKVPLNMRIIQRSITGFYEKRISISE